MARAYADAMFTRLFALALLAVLAACASGGGRPPAPEPARPVVATRTEPLAAGVGRSAAQLERLLGAPALDVREGTARKLQFRSPVCVIDFYLYPPRGGAEPVVTHIDARRPTGEDFDGASCFAALAAQAR